MTLTSHLNTYPLGLGRRPSPDARDQAHPMRAILAVAPVLPPYRYWPIMGAPLNQGAEGTCVGYAWKHWMMAAPVVSKPAADPQATAIYDDATRLDEWPGNEGDRQSGTSVRAAAQALQNRAILAEYLWAWDVETVLAYVLTKGPVVVGTNWYASMFTPDADGLLPVSGAVVGGHAYLLIGANQKMRRFRMLNSWGRSWGQSGRGWLAFDALARLLSEGGEACTAAEVHA